MRSLLSRSRFSRGTAVFLCAIIIVGLVAASILFFGGMVGISGDDGTESPISSPVENHQQDSSTDAIPSDTEHDGEETNSSRERLVVRLEPLSKDSETVTTSALEEHANTTQEAFVTSYEDERAVEIVEQFWMANALLVDVQTDRISRSELEDAPGVVHVHENFEVTPSASTIETGPGDAGVGTGPPYAVRNTTTTAGPSPTGGANRYAYGVEMVRAPTVWERFETRGDGVTVAVLDTGIDPKRADLTVDEWAEFDTHGARIDSTPYDSHGHGTHVAGTVVGDDASGLAIGVAPDAALYGVKVTNDDGSGTFAQILAGMEWATAQDEVDIIQMSMGASGRVQAYHEPVMNARNTGALVVAASGNDGHGTSSSPGNLYDTLSVGAVGMNGQVPPFSSGETLDTTAEWNWTGSPPSNWPESYVVPSVTAPGVHIPSAAAGSETSVRHSSGTSMATPHVSGVAALMLATVDAEPDPEEVSAVIRETSVHPRGSETPDDRYGHGVVDALTAVERLTETSTATTTFDVEVIGTNSPVTTGEILEIETEITNRGTAEGTQEIALDIDGIGPIDTANVTLAPGEKTTRTLSWQTAASSIGEFTATVTSDDDADSTTVTVDALHPAQFEIETVEFDEQVTAGEEFNVTATVRNTGDVEGNQEISLEVGDSTVDTVTLLLTANESETVTLSWSTEPDDVGEQPFTITSFDDEQTHSVNVEPGESDEADVGSSDDQKDGEPADELTPDESTDQQTPDELTEKTGDSSDQSASGFVFAFVLAVVGVAVFALLRWRAS